MVRFLKYIGLSLLALIGGYIIFVLIGSLAFMSLSFHDTPSCGKDSEAANYARSLSNQRLTELYNDMARMYGMNEVPYEGYTTFDSRGLPKEFADLKVKIVRPKQTNIMVEGCFDHYMYLHFKGISDNEPKQIILQYGEHPIGLEVLWPEGQEA